MNTSHTGRTDRICHHSSLADCRHKSGGFRPCPPYPDSRRCHPRASRSVCRSHPTNWSSQARRSDASLSRSPFHALRSKVSPRLRRPPIIKANRTVMRVSHPHGRGKPDRMPALELHNPAAIKRRNAPQRESASRPRTPESQRKTSHAIAGLCRTIHAIDLPGPRTLGTILIRRGPTFFHAPRPPLVNAGIPYHLHGVNHRLSAGLLLAGFDGVMLTDGFPCL